MAGDEQQRMVEVHVLGMPLDLFVRSQEHQEGLNRELALIQAGDWAPPARLQQLIDTLRERFKAFLEQPTALRDAAIARGDKTVDLTYHVPVAVRDAALTMRDLLDEVDAYCRRGELLTLATPAELVAFREWFLGQFIDQVDGKPAVAWAQWRGGR